MPLRRRSFENAWALDPLDLPSERAMERVPALRGLEHNAAFRMMAFRRRTATGGTVAQCVLGSLLLDDVLELHAAGFPAEEIVRAAWGASASRRTLGAVDRFAKALAVGAAFCLAGSLFTLGQESGVGMFWVGLLAAPVSALCFVALRHEPYALSSTGLISIAAFGGRVKMLETARKRRTGEAVEPAVLSTLGRGCMLWAAIAGLLLAAGIAIGGIWAVISTAFRFLGGAGILWREGFGPPALVVFLWFIAGLIAFIQERAARSGAMAAASEKRLADSARILSDTFALLNGDGIIEGLRGRKL